MREECKLQLKKLNACVVIPTYNNEKTLAEVIREVKIYASDIIVVNDGSTDATPAILQSIEAIHVCSYAKNKGKGYALQTGFRKALEMGFDYAITLDSDGQHFPSDIPSFVEKAHDNPQAIWVGSRNLQQENMPGRNTFANRFSNFWFRLETGIKLDDTQSGFRWYPLQLLKHTRYFTRKYDFELEVLVRSAWKKIPVQSVPVRVFYAPKDERVSHFKPFRDFTRISILNTFLVLIALLWVKPFAFIRSLNKENIRRFVNKEVLVSSDSNARIAGAIALGVFMGIVPIWGYQMLVAFALAHVLKLNKVITLVASNISIPPMLPLILFGSFALGAVLLDNPLQITFHDVTLDTVKRDFWQYIVGSFALATSSAVLIGGISWILLSIFRRRSAV